MEIAYGRFEAVVELPCALTPCQVATIYQDGMLLIDIRYKEAKL
jgi:HSP20 family molecular chaperone IbpA